MSSRYSTGRWFLCLLMVLGALEEAVAYGVNSGGKTSVSRADNNAFSLPSANMSFERRLDFSVGNSFFRNPWVIAPASTTSRDGLGPLFNTNGCQNCHIKDGRGHLPASKQDNAVSVLVRVSLKPKNKKEWAITRAQGVIPEPNYGDQFQDFAIPGVKPEVSIQFDYVSKHVTLKDGINIILSKPVARFSQLVYGPLHPDAVTSIRLAPPMIGLGLLEAIPKDDLLRLQDEKDKNKDGISGRINWVMNQASGELDVGRFGWKAEQPSVEQQNAGAFSGDIGITSNLFPKKNCQKGQAACTKAVDGGMPELSDKTLRLVTFYARNLGVPKRRNSNDPQVKAGQTLFESAECHLCHVVTYKTAKLESQPEQSDQTIHPYTDLLLHDMGSDLADNRPVFMATGSEWRTPPLWGIGLTKQVSGSEHYLHDGRARSLLEAILWHGGEAQKSRDAVILMNKKDREALIAFLKSL